MRKRTLLSTLAFPFLVFSPGCFTNSQTKSLQADIDAVQVQLLQLQREHAALRGQLEDQAEMVQTAVASQSQEDLVTRADEIAHVDEIGREMEVLGEKLDDTNYRLSALRAEIQATRSLWERTLSAGLEVVPAEGGAEGGDPVTGIPGAAATLPLVAGGGSPEEIFNTVYADYTKGNYPLAILGFQEYLEKFSNSDFADDSLYWVGESYYSQGKFTDAVQAFGEVVRRYPDGDKVPASHLKRAYAFLESNQTAQGVVQLNALIEEFPDTDEARLARERMRNLGLRDR